MVAGINHLGSEIHLLPASDGQDGFWNIVVARPANDELGTANDQLRPARNHLPCSETFGCQLKGIVHPKKGFAGNLLTLRPSKM